jgi:ADP-heptose:LPS heptosyltransferase
MDIAILRRNGLGDLLCAYPLVLYLQKKYPTASITLFVDQRNAPLIPYLPQVKEVAVFPESGNKYWNLLRMALRYRNRFDLALSAKTSPMKLANFFLYGLKAKKRIAYVDRSWHTCFVNHPISYDALLSKKKHQALKGLQMVAPELEEVPETLYPTVQVPLEIKQKYPIQTSFQHPTLLVSATTTRAESRFAADRYAALLNRLHHFLPIGVRIIGQKEDRERAGLIARHLVMPHQVHIPQNFDEFMVLAAASDLFFVGDGGVAHIGAALGKKVVTLFGQTSPVEWRPLSKEAEVFYHPLHVDHLCDETLFKALKRKLSAVHGGV